MSAANILETIENSLDGLRKSDRRVAEAILASPHDIPNMRLTDMAALANVSEPTVIRFANAIGLKGYQELKIRLAQSLALGLSTSHAAIEPGDTLSQLVTKMFDFNLTNLDWARQHLDLNSLEAAIAALENARSIEWYGLGASGIVAADAQQKFPLFDVPCHAPANEHQMFIGASMLGPHDVAVGISNTGESASIAEILDVARDNGATTIAIVGRDSPVAKSADIVLMVETLENTDLYTPTISRVAALVVIDLLSTAVSLRKDECHSKRLKKMKLRLSQFRKRFFLEG